MSEPIDWQIQTGPCVLCGAINYPLSMGGPSICCACDCGANGPGQVAQLRREVANLRALLARAREDLLRYGAGAFVEGAATLAAIDKELGGAGENDAATGGKAGARQASAQGRTGGAFESSPGDLTPEPQAATPAPPDPLVGLDVTDIVEALGSGAGENAGDEAWSRAGPAPTPAPPTHAEEVMPNATGPLADSKTRGRDVVEGAAHPTHAEPVTEAELLRLAEIAVRCGARREYVSWSGSGVRENTPGMYGLWVNNEATLALERWRREGRC